MSSTRSAEICCPSLLLASPARLRPRTRSSTSTTGRTTSTRRCWRSSPRRPASRSSTTSTTTTRSSRPSCSPAAPATTSSCRPTPTWRARSRPARCMPLDKSKLPNLVHQWAVITKRLDDLRSRQRIRRQLHVGHDRHRLQRRQDQGSACPTRRSTPGTCSSSPRSSPKFKPIAASTCSTRRRTLIPAALNYLGLDPGLEGPGRHREGRRAARQAIRPYIQKFHSSEYINALANGDICLAVGYSGDILQSRKTALRKPRPASRSTTSSRRRAR